MVECPQACTKVSDTKGRFPGPYLVEPYRLYILHSYVTIIIRRSVVVKFIK